MADRTVTVGSSGGADYATLNAAFAGEAGYDCVTNTGQLYIDCYNFEDTTAVNYNGTAITTNSSYKCYVRAVHDHGGVWSSTTYRLNITADATALRIDSAIEDLVFEGIQIRHAQTVGSDSRGITIEIVPNQSGGVFEFDKCIIIEEHQDAEDRIEPTIYTRDSQTTYKFRNCLFYGPGSATKAWCFEDDSYTGTRYIDNCTIDGFQYGFQHNFSSAYTVRNTRVTGCTAVMSTGNSYNLNSNSDYNLTNASAPTNWGTNSIDSTDTPTISYVDSSNATYTSRDYHLQAGDSGIGAGQDLSGDANNPFSDDIDGDTRG